MANAQVPATVADIPGWFTWTDQQLFRLLLTRLAPAEPQHVVELGTYLGKSAAFTGEFLRADERFVVCDLFGDSSDDANDVEVDRSYQPLTRTRFETNFRAVRGWLPEIVQGPSATIVDHLPERSVRFLHVDASHLFEHVRVDVESVVRLLADDGVVAFDDFRAEHTPGVGAAVWGAVGRGLLSPVLLTPSKLYAVREHPERVTDQVHDWLLTFGRLRWEQQQIAGVRVLRIWPPAPPADPRTAASVEARLRELEDAVRAGFGGVLTNSAGLDRRLAEVGKEVKGVRSEVAGVTQDVKVVTREVKAVSREVKAVRARRSLPERVLRRGYRTLRSVAGHDGRDDRDVP